VAKAAGRAVRVAVLACLAPTQLGFGIKQGTEASAHAARRFMQDLGPGQALLKLDFSNAFNALMLVVRHNDTRLTSVSEVKLSRARLVPGWVTV
jgi:hypothetical protein